MKMVDQLFWIHLQLIAENPTILFRPALSERRQGCSYFDLLSFMRFQKGMALYFPFSIFYSSQLLFLECTNVVQEPIFPLNRKSLLCHTLTVMHSHVLPWYSASPRLWNLLETAPLLYPLERTSRTQELASVAPREHSAEHSQLKSKLMQWVLYFFCWGKGKECSLLSTPADRTALMNTQSSRRVAQSQAG